VLRNLEKQHWTAVESGHINADVPPDWLWPEAHEPWTLACNEGDPAANITERKRLVRPQAPLQRGERSADWFNCRQGARDNKYAGCAG
jgi:hypothetical protein